MMRRLLGIGIGILVAASTAALANDAAVSITVGQPGFYGRIDIGDYPPPQLIFPEAVIIEPVGVVRMPVYLRVPPGHAKHWTKHCHRYDACNQRVYFVQDDWYEHTYMPDYHRRHGKKGKKKKH